MPNMFVDLVVPLIGELLRWISLLIFRILIFVFFNDVEVLGRENIPRTGAVIFVCNHRNQFVDVLVMLSHSTRTPAFIIAAVSLKRKVIAFFSWVLRCIPVFRPRDLAKWCQGTIHTKGNVVHGTGTKFTAEFEPGDELMIHERPSLRARVVSVQSDEQLTLHESVDPPLKEGQKFKVYKKVDQGEVFVKVWEELAKGNSIGIFPEGSSHDRPSLLPLQPGVTLMALGAVDKHNVNVHIVPCGLTYFSGHRFRGHVIAEFGKPIVISPNDERIARYRDPKTKRDACSELLEQVEKRLRSVTVNVPSFEMLQILYLARRLYQPTSGITSADFQLLNRRFAAGYLALKDNPQVKEAAEKCSEYYHLLKHYGLRDDQVASGAHQVDTNQFLRIIASRFIKLVGILLLGLPGALLMLPVGMTARLYAWWKAKVIAPNDPNSMYGAKDVVASYKIIVAGFGVPMLFVAYTLLAWYIWDIRTAFILLSALPVFTYASVLLMEKGFGEFRLLAAVLTMQRSKNEVNTLLVTRYELRKKIRMLVEDLGPTLGEEIWDEKFFAKMRDSIAKEIPEEGTKKLQWRHRSFIKISDTKGE